MGGGPQGSTGPAPSPSITAMHACKPSPSSPVCLPVCLPACLPACLQTQLGSELAAARMAIHSERMGRPGMQMQLEALQREKGVGQAAVIKLQVRLQPAGAIVSHAGGFSSRAVVSHAGCS